MAVQSGFLAVGILLLIVLDVTMAAVANKRDLSDNGDRLSMAQLLIEYSDVNHDEKLSYTELVNLLVQTRGVSEQSAGYLANDLMREFDRDYDKSIDVNEMEDAVASLNGFFAMLQF